MNNTLQRIILEVPFKDKNEAKELGAWWDPQIKKWFIPRGKDPALFARWIPSENGGELQTQSSKH